MKLLHALTQPERSGVPQLVFFVIDVSTNVSNLKSDLRNVVRPVALYGSECWLTIKDNERRLAVMETKMLRRTSDVTRFERRLRWYGYVIRANENSLAMIGLNIEVDGKRPKGWPKQGWLDTLDGDLKASRSHPDQAFDRAKWRNRL